MDAERTESWDTSGGCTFVWVALQLSGRMMMLPRYHIVILNPYQGSEVITVVPFAIKVARRYCRSPVVTPKDKSFVLSIAHVESAVSLLSL